MRFADAGAAKGGAAKGGAGKGGAGKTPAVGRADAPDARVETFADLDALPANAAPLFDAAPDFFATRAWWELVLAHALPSDGVPRLTLVRTDGVPRALVPMLLDRASGEHRSLTTPYTCSFAPLLAPDAPDRALPLAAFARMCRSFATTRLDALDEAVAEELTAAARTAGLAVARFDHFGNWREDVSGLDWPGYLARRPGALRETVRRRTRRAERLEDARFQVFDSADGLEEGIAAFEDVYARSWKEPEPFPAINPAQIRAAAGLGIGRLGVWWIGGTPAAAQFWIVERGQATVLKLAHDEAFKTYSPGTVVTAWMIRRMIETEGIGVLDFGRGDDAYKKDWVGERRQKVGVVLINPWRVRGAVALVRHWAGRVRAGLRQGE